MPSTSRIPARRNLPGARLVGLLVIGTVAVLLAMTYTWGALRTLDARVEDQLVLRDLRAEYADLRLRMQDISVTVRGFAVSGNPLSLDSALTATRALVDRGQALEAVDRGRVGDAALYEGLRDGLDAIRTSVTDLHARGAGAQAQARALLASGAGPQYRLRVLEQIAALDATAAQALAAREAEATATRRQLARALPLTATMGLALALIAVLVVRSQVQARRADLTRYRAIFDNTFQFVGLLSPDGTLLEANETALAFAALRPDDVLQRPFWEAAWWQGSEETRETLRQGIRRAAKGEFVRYPVEVLGADGRRVWIDFSLKPVRGYDGSVEFIVPEGRDVTEVRAAEQALAEAEARWNFALSGSDLGVWDWDATTNAVFFSDRWKAMLGYAPGEIGGSLDEWQDRVHPDDLAETMHALREHLDGRTPFYESTHRMRTRDGNWRWILDRGKVVARNPDGTPRRVIGTHQDVTERREADARIKALQQQLTALLEHSPTLIALFDDDERYLVASGSLARIFGRPTAEIVGRRVEELRDAETLAVFRKRFAEVRAADAPIEIEDTVGQGEHRHHYRTVMFPVRDAEGRRFATGSIAIDLTETFRAQERLERALAERETLLREVHHRVKNNLQVVSSLLSLQARVLSDSTARAILEESRQRVHTMSVIHERLYKHADLERIPFGDYVSELIRLQRGSYGVSEDRVRPTVDVQVPPLSLALAVPCGLIVNELLSNAFKHAWPDGRPGHLTVRFIPDGARWVLIVADDGVGTGAPPGSASLGLQLIEALVGQLDGTMDIGSDRGRTVRISFPAPT